MSSRRNSSGPAFERHAELTAPVCSHAMTACDARGPSTSARQQLAHTFLRTDADPRQDIVGRGVAALVAPRDGHLDREGYSAASVAPPTDGTNVGKRKPTANR